MENLRKLEIAKLIKELDYVESEYVYKSEIIKEIDTKFKQEVENILSENENLKNIFKSSLDKFNTLISNQEVRNGNNIENDIDEYIVVDKDPKIKTLYRIIAKSTHPDKVNDESLKELYIEATKAYENNSLYPIISICDKLKIPFEISDEEINLLKEKVDSTKKRSDFLETTYTWQWHSSQDLNKKREIVLQFITSQIF